MKYARQCSRGSRTPVTLRWTDQCGLDWTGETGRDETCEARKHGVLCWLDRGSRFETTTDEQNKEKAPLVASQVWVVRYRYRWER